MGRPRQFDAEAVLDAAVGVFREHGFDGSSADMLVGAMQIGRQSLYDTFGDKWQLYRAAVRRYVTVETSASIAALRDSTKAMDGLTAMIDRVVATARDACLGVNSICEFGTSRADLSEIHAAADGVQRRAVIERVSEAIADGDLDADLVPDHVATFLTASIAGIRIAARSGAPDDQIAMLGAMALRALRPG